MALRLGRTDNHPLAWIQLDAFGFVVALEVWW